MSIKRTIIVLVLLAFAAIAVSCTHTATVRNEKGSKMKLALSQNFKVNLNGSRQAVYVAGADKDSPILLWLDGGPGGSEVGWVRRYLGPLHNHFTIVCWDQRGTAASYGALRKADTIETYVSDVIALSEHLITRYGQQKIFLLGHSWGGFIGALAAQQRPDLYYAYIAASPHVNSTENDTIGYRMILGEARKRGDKRTVEKLEAIGLPPYEKVEKSGKVVGDGDAYFEVLRRLYAYSPKAPSDHTFKSQTMFAAPEHSLGTRLNLVRGLVRGVKQIYPQLRHRTLEEEAVAFDCPLIVVNAAYDYSCVHTITERWYSKTSAPQKKYLHLMESGHNGIYTEADRFIDFMVNEVLVLKP